MPKPSPAPSSSRATHGSRQPPGRGARCAGFRAAIRPPRLLGRTPHRRRRRDTAPSGEGRHRRKLPARARLRPRLSRGLVPVAATGQTLPWPAPEALLIKFVAHHLWDPAKRETDFAHGMPEDVTAALKAARPVARRRAARAEHRPPAAVELVDADRLARSCRKIQCAGPAQRHKTRRACQRPPARQKEQKGGDRRHSRPPCSRPAPAIAWSTFATARFC